MPREILVDWTTPAGAGFRSVLYFEETASVALQRADIGTMLGAIDATFDGHVTWVVETSGRELDSATGALTGAWVEPTNQSGAGALAGNTVPDVAQVLLRWSTGQVVNGRFLKGRTYLPGLASASILEGNILPATVTTIQTAVNAFIAAAHGFGVWHRPVGGAGGDHVVANGGSVWTEFAVLRQRRN